MRENDNEEGERVRQESWRVGGQGKEQAGQSQREQVTGTESRMRPVRRQSEEERAPPVCIPISILVVEARATEGEWAARVLPLLRVCCG